MHIIRYIISSKKVKEIYLKFFDYKTKEKIYFFQIKNSLSNDNKIYNIQINLNI